MRNAILLSSIIGVATLTMAWAIQAYIVDVSLSEKTSSILWVALNGTVAFVSLFAAFLLYKYGLHRLLRLLIVVIPITYIIMGVSPFSIVVPLLFVFYAVRGYATPLLKDLIQQNCESDIRATVLSIRGLIIRMSFGVLGPIIGVATDIVSLQFAMISIGGFFILTIGSIYFLYVTENLLYKTDVD